MRNWNQSVDMYASYMQTRICFEDVKRGDGEANSKANRYRQAFDWVDFIFQLPLVKLAFSLNLIAVIKALWKSSA